jgi:GT2 family glycosyltransferase
VPSLACIIPVVGNTDGLESTLGSVLERRPDGCEVLVVLAAAYHDPYDLKGEIQFLQAPPGAGLVDCVNLGISATRAPIVHLLAAGSEVDSGWIERALVHFDDPRIAAVTPLVYDRIDRERILSAGVSCGRGGGRIVHHSMPMEDKSSPASVGPVVQAAFYRRSALEALGGGLPLDVGDDFADIDLAGSLRQANWHLKLEPSCRIFGSSIGKPLSGRFVSGRASERFYWRHFSEAGGLIGLFTHCLVVIGDLMRCKPFWKAPAELLGRLAAVCQLGFYRKYRQLVAASGQDARAAQDEWQAIQKLTESDSKAAPTTTHRVDVPHKVIKPKSSSGQRRTCRQKKYR